MIRMRQFLLLLISLGLAAGTPTFLKAAEILPIPYYNDDGTLFRAEILIRGTIQPGDFEKLVMLRDRLFHANEATLSLPTTVYLDSEGGSLQEAMKIGRYIRQNYLGTSIWPIGVDRTGKQIVEKDDIVCASACVFIFFAGADRHILWNGQKWPLFGLHRPYRDPVDFAHLSASEADRLYAKIIHAATLYLQEMNTPQQYIDRMIDTSSTEIDALTPQEMFNLRWMLPSLDELLIARCGSLSPEDQSFLDAGLAGQAPIDETEQFARHIEIQECRDEELYMERLRQHARLKLGLQAGN